jgi:solute carrier family 45, member 1/2/4
LLTPIVVDEPDDEIVQLRYIVRAWRIEAASKGKPLKLPRMPFMLRNIWTGALLLFSFLMLSTFFVTTVAHVSSAQ